MPSHQSAVSTLIREVLADPDLAHDDVFRRLLQAGLQDLVDAEAAAVIGAGRYERTPERTNRRNGKRLKTVATTAGEVELAIPKLRTGSFFPSLLHPRRRVDKALYAVICQAWIEGVSTRARSTTWSRPWAMSPGSPGPRSPGSARTSTRTCTSSCPAAWTTPDSPTCSWTPRTWT
jgi:transposase, mutator family